MNEQPEALLLADLIQSRYSNELNDDAADELRRLHQENEALRDWREMAQLNCAKRNCAQRHQINCELDAENDALQAENKALADRVDALCEQLQYAADSFRSHGFSVDAEECEEAIRGNRPARAEEQPR